MENKDLTLMIEQDILLRYVDGTASSEEIRIVESAIKEDPFLEEAIEGLKSVTDKNVLNIHLASISEEISQKTNFYPTKAAKIINLPNLPFKAIISIAASIIIISGTYLIAHNLIKSNKEIAQNSDNKNDKESTTKEVILDEKTVIINPAEKSKEALNTEVKTQEINTGVAEDKEVNQTTPYSISTAPAANTDKQTATYSWTMPTTTTGSDVVANKNIIKGQVLDSKTKTPIAGVNVISGKVSTLSSQNGYYEIALDDGVKDLEFSQPGYQDQAKKLTTSGSKTINVELNKSFESDIVATTKQEKTSEESTKDNSVSITDDFKKGLDEYSNQEYEKAIVSFNKVLQKNPNSPEANYYNGLANYNTNKNTKALGYFNKVIKANNKYSLDAKWQKAQILLQQNNYTEAEPILEELKNTSKYKSQADALLNNKK
ncbi:MAG: carboxypeptidase-like regulatory domain-containing protein [Bacteroidota bacterium]